jgi:hypothetical protein
LCVEYQCGLTRYREWICLENQPCVGKQ